MRLEALIQVVQSFYRWCGHLSRGAQVGLLVIVTALVILAISPGARRALAVAWDWSVVERFRHKKWQVDVRGDDGPFHHVVTSEGAWDNYSLFVQFPWSTDLYIKPRPGWPLVAIRKFLDVLSDKFLGPHEKIRYNDVLPAPWWLRRLGFGHRVVHDPTLSPVEYDEVRQAFEREIQKRRPAQRLGVVPVGLLQNRRAAFVDLCRGPSVIIGGSSGSGKSEFIKNLLDAMLEIEGVRLFIIDLSGMFFARDWPGVEAILDTPAAILRHVEYLQGEEGRRRDVLKSRGVDDFRRLPEALRPPLLISLIDEGLDLFGGELASDARGAPPEERTFLQIQTGFGRLLSTSRKTGIVSVISLVEPLQTHVPRLRLSKGTTRIGFDCASDAVSASFAGDSSLNDPTLTMGRCRIRTPSIPGWAIMRTWHRPADGKKPGEDGG